MAFWIHARQKINIKWKQNCYNIIKLKYQSASPDFRSWVWLSPWSDETSMSWHSEGSVMNILAMSSFAWSELESLVEGLDIIVHAIVILLWTHKYQSGNNVTKQDWYYIIPTDYFTESCTKSIIIYGVNEWQKVHVQKPQSVCKTTFVYKTTLNAT